MERPELGVAVATPCYAGMVTARFAESLVATMGDPMDLLRPPFAAEEAAA